MGSEQASHTLGFPSGLHPQVGSAAAPVRALSHAIRTQTSSKRRLRNLEMSKWRRCFHTLVSILVSKPPRSSGKSSFWAKPPLGDQGAGPMTPLPPGQNTAPGHSREGHAVSSPLLTRALEAGRFGGFKNTDHPAFQRAKCQAPLPGESNTGETKPRA